MTVKKLAPTEQQMLVLQFQDDGRSINYLAGYYQCSRRTVIRVLEDAGVDPGIQRRKSKKQLELKMPPPAEIDLSGFPTLIYQTPAPKPWYQKVYNSVRQFFVPDST